MLLVRLCWRAMQGPAYAFSQDLLVRLLERDAIGKIVLESNAVPAYAFSQGLLVRLLEREAIGKIFGKRCYW